MFIPSPVTIALKSPALRTLIQPIFQSATTKEHFPHNKAVPGHLTSTVHITELLLSLKGVTIKALAQQQSLQRLDTRNHPLPGGRCSGVKQTAFKCL